MSDLLDQGSERALKLIHLKPMGAAASERARREARLLAGAKHPALVPCRRWFEDLDAGLIGLVFDFVPGRTLADALADPRMSRAHRAAALDQIAAALAHVHALDIVHRDLKTDNVLVTERFWTAPRDAGSIKLLDFGIAIPVGNPRPLTIGGLVGTFAYLAPEVLDPTSWNASDQGFSRDLFAFGVIAWEVLYGRHPTGLGPDASMIDYARAYMAAQQGRIPWPPSGPEAPWAPAIAACLALRPESRPDKGEALVRILRAAGRSSVPSITDPHRTATEAMPTPPVIPRPASTTTPMPVVPMTQAMAPRKSALGTILKATLFVGSSTLGVVVLVKSGSLDGLVDAQNLPAPSVEPSLPLLPTASTQAPAPLPEPVGETCGAPCCGGTSCPADAQDTRNSICYDDPGHCAACESGRTCIPGACSDKLDPIREWLLRLAGVDHPLPPTAQVCVRRSGVGPIACTPMSEAADNPDAPPSSGMATRLRVSTADLQSGGGVDIYIFDGTIIASRPAAFHETRIKSSALCVGLRFKVQDLFVTFYLDDP